MAAKKTRVRGTDQQAPPFLSIHGDTSALSAYQISIGTPADMLPLSWRLPTPGECGCLPAGVELPRRLLLQGIVRNHLVPLDLDVGPDLLIHQVHVRLVDGPHPRWELEWLSRLPRKQSERRKVLARGDVGVRQISYQRFYYVDETATVETVRLNLFVSKSPLAWSDEATVKADRTAEIKPPASVEDVRLVTFETFEKGRLSVGVIAIEESQPGLYFVCHEGRTVAGPRNVLAPGAVKPPPSA